MMVLVIGIACQKPTVRGATPVRVKLPVLRLPSLTLGLLTPLQIWTLVRNDSPQMTGTAPNANSRIELGNQQAAAIDVSEKSSLVLASYNIRYAVGRYLIASGMLRKFGHNFPPNRELTIKHNIAKAARAFSENRLLPTPDILALQEADKRTGRAGGQHIAAQLAEKMGVQYVHVGIGLPTGTKPKQREWWLNFEEQVAIDDSGDMGVALLSRVALHDIERIDLPWHDCPWRPRVAVAATTNWRDQKLRLFNVHIDPHGPLDNQHQQTEAVLEIAEQHKGPTVISGDFNTLSKQKAIEIRKLMESSGYTTPFPTDVATWRGAGIVRFHADWIFGRGVQFKRWGVATPLNVSDHWPVWAEIEL
ncbi:MAG TPA: endonuclease/exonuclease/phosphatase family protein [Pyrinomonadaceae bacterium]